MGYCLLGHAWALVSVFCYKLSFVYELPVNELSWLLYWSFGKITSFIMCCHANENQNLSGSGIFLRMPQFDRSDLRSVKVSLLGARVREPGPAYYGKFHT